jgi:hypothetical protein
MKGCPVLDGLFLWKSMILSTVILCKFVLKLLFFVLYIGVTHQNTRNLLFLKY